MSYPSPPRAPLLVSIPPERYRLITHDAKPPKAGDTVVLDQGYTGPNGEPMCLAYQIDSDGNSKYEVEVYESELGEDLPPVDSDRQ